MGTTTPTDLCHSTSSPKISSSVYASGPRGQDAAAGSLAEVIRIVGQLRTRWPGVRIVLRADSGFCREEIMAWCEESQVDYLFGLARNERLGRTIEASMEQARRLHESSGKPARFFTEFAYRTLSSWSRERRGVAKAECLEKGENPRFVVTSLSTEELPPRELYEKLYCAPGRDGESNQGAAPPLCRPALDRADGQ